MASAHQRIRATMTLPAIFEVKQGDETFKVTIKNARYPYWHPIGTTACVVNASSASQEVDIAPTRIFFPYKTYKDKTLGGNSHLVRDITHLYPTKQMYEIEALIRGERTIFVEMVGRASIFISPIDSQKSFQPITRYISQSADPTTTRDVDTMNTSTDYSSAAARSSSLTSARPNLQALEGLTRIDEEAGNDEITYPTPTDTSALPNSAASSAADGIDLSRVRLTED